MITESQYDILKQSDTTFPKFTFKNKIIFGKVIKVYDGDTCQINTYIQMTYSDLMFDYMVMIVLN